MKWSLGLMALLMCCTAGAAAQAQKTALPKEASSPQLSAHLREVVAGQLKSLVAPRFAVTAEDPLDAELRAAAEAMRDEHLVRVQALMETWFDEELRQEPLRSAVSRLQARVLNEFALWGRDSTGPDYDAALAQALQTPGLCNPGPKYESNELVLRLMRLRGLSPEVRRQAVQAERELLARWGRPRQVSDAEPLPAEEQLLQLRTPGRVPHRAVPPVLALYYLGDVDDRRRDPGIADPSTRCAMHQWAGASPAQFRAAMALQAPQVLFVGGSRQSLLDDEGYPLVVRHLEVRGVVTVQAEVNASGRLVRAKVVRRALTVPGIREARPWAFEGVMDFATLARARKVDWQALAPREGVATVERDFTWDPK